MERNTAPFDYTGHPAISLNVAYTDQSLPIGGMIVAKRFQEAKLLNVAYALEQKLKEKGVKQEL